MSYQRKRRRFIHEYAVGRFHGGEGGTDEASLPLPVQEKLRNLRQELGQLSQALALRNLDLLELRREVRVLHRRGAQVERLEKRTEAEQAVLHAARGAKIRTTMGGAPCTPFFMGPTEAELCRAVLAWRGQK